MTEQDADELVALVIECRATARRATADPVPGQLEADDYAWRAVLQWVYERVG